MQGHTLFSGALNDILKYGSLSIVIIFNVNLLGSKVRYFTETTKLFCHFFCW